jgi:hypothetical protein
MTRWVKCIEMFLIEGTVQKSLQRIAVDSVRSLWAPNKAEVSRWAEKKANVQEGASSMEFAGTLKALICELERQLNSVLEVIKWLRQITGLHVQSLRRTAAFSVGKSRYWHR